MIDYTKGKNIASDVICDGLRVSTATFPSDEFGEDALVETWIFGDKEKGFRSKQYIHKRRYNRARIIKFHNYIVQRLKRKFPPVVQE